MPRKPYECRVVFTGIKTCPDPQHPELYEVDYRRCLHHTEPFVRLRDAIEKAQKVSRNGGEATVVHYALDGVPTIVVHYSPLQVALADLVEGHRP